jgi:hypothetical protein
MRVAGFGAFPRLAFPEAATISLECNTTMEDINV